MYRARGCVYRSKPASYKSLPGRVLKLACDAEWTAWCFSVRVCPSVLGAAAAKQAGRLEHLSHDARGPIKTSC